MVALRARRAVGGNPRLDPLRRSAESAEGDRSPAPAGLARSPLPAISRAGATPQDLLLLQRAAGNRAVSQIALLQRQKAPGRYQLTKEGRLRSDAPPTYPVRYTIPKGARVQVEDKGTRTSNFKAGRKTNEHSWSTWQSPGGATSGWIEDSKLKAVPEPPRLPTVTPPPASTGGPRPASSAPAKAEPQPRPQTEAMGIGGNKGPAAKGLSTGSTSFRAGLTLQGLGDLDKTLLANVRFTEVKPVDQNKLKVQILGDRLYTHDGKHRLDSDGELIRYVLCRVGDDGLQLYASQTFEVPTRASDTDDDEPDVSETEPDVSEPAVKVDLISTYPFMSSHAQVATGNVIGAGDFIVQDGQVIEISNQSGTWYPRGNHLVTALRAMTAWRVLDLALVKSGEIAVKQFLPAGDAVDVDKGDLVTIGPLHLQDL
jgi:hypothetical protein